MLRKFIAKEILEQNAILETAFHRKIHSFAFPYGKYRSNSINFVAQHFEFIRSIHYINHPKFLCMDTCIESKDFWDKYQESFSKGYFLFFGHSLHVKKSVIRKTFEKMLEDGCKFLTHYEFWKCQLGSNVESHTDN